MIPAIDKCSGFPIGILIPETDECPPGWCIFGRDCSKKGKAKCKPCGFTIEEVRAVAPPGTEGLPRWGWVVLDGDDVVEAYADGAEGWSAAQRAHKTSPTTMWRRWLVEQV